jgi:hypothetical protein
VAYHEAGRPGRSRAYLERALEHPDGLAEAEHAEELLERIPD